MKIIEIIFLASWTLLFLVDAIRHCSHYSLPDWIVFVFIIVAPYFFVWSMNHMYGKKKNIHAVKKEVAYNLPPVIKNPNSMNEPSVNPEPVHSQPVNYVEANNDIYRTDGKPITDEEVPYLIQIGYEKTLQDAGFSEIPMLDLSYMKERDKNKARYTSLPKFYELDNIPLKKTEVTSTDIFFLKYINGRTLENPTIAQYWFYNYNLNYSEEIKKLIANGLLTLEKVNLVKLKVTELKDILRNFSLSLSGKKQELIERIHSNIPQDKLEKFLGDNTHYFTATEDGLKLINSINDSATKNLELENSCIELIMNYQFSEAYSLIADFKHSMPGEMHINYSYNPNMDDIYEDIMDTNPFFYTLSKDRDIEPQIRASVIFCRMYGCSQDDTLKIIKRIYADNNRDFNEDTQNILRGRLL